MQLAAIARRHVVLTALRWLPTGLLIPVLVVLGPEEEAAAKSFRNIPKVTVLPATAAGVADVIGHRSLIVSQAALPVLEARAGDVKRGRAAETGRQAADDDGDDG